MVFFFIVCYVNVVLLVMLSVVKCSGCLGLVKCSLGLFFFYEQREEQDEHTRSSPSKVSSLRSARPEAVFEKALIMFASKRAALRKQERIKPTRRPKCGRVRCDS